MKWHTDSSGGLFSQPKGHRDAGEIAFDDLIAGIKKDEEAAEALPPPVVVMPAAVAVVFPGLVKYETFPVTYVTEELTTDDPRVMMTALCRELLIHKDYPRIRNEYCRLSIRLNLVGKLAPAFRPVLKSGAKWGDMTIHHQIHRDQVVIDLHWCHATKMGLSPTEPNHQALYADPLVFPFNNAYALAGKRMKSVYRASEALCLTTMQQCQLLKLRGPDVLARQDALENGWRVSAGKKVSKIAAAKKLIGEWVERDKRIASRRVHYEQLWLARELLEPGAKAAQIGALLALMVREVELDRRTIFGQLKQLDNHVTLP